MKLWRLMLLILCLSVSACTSTRDFYEAVYSSLQFHTNTRNPPDSAPYLDRPMSFQQYEDEREALLESRDK
jgi:hypothetical protein